MCIRNPTTIPTLLIYSAEMRFTIKRKADDTGRCPLFIVAMATEVASAAQLVTVEFDIGVAVSEELDSCTISRKYVINSPISCKRSSIRKT